jgi:hypothetical protein
MLNTALLVMHFQPYMYICEPSSPNEQIDLLISNYLLNIQSACIKQ